MDDKGQDKESKALSKDTGFDSFVLEKSIFSNVFDKDIRRVYLYKKAERLARAVHLIAPAFVNSPALRVRADQIAVALVDGAVLPPLAARENVSRELLALSSLLAMARTGGLLSAMNAELIARESHLLLEELASYEEPRMSLDPMQSIAELTRESRKGAASSLSRLAPRAALPAARPAKQARLDKGHVSDNDKGHSAPVNASRREAIVSVIRTKGPSRIKDISTLIRDVSEKTIQRELQALVTAGILIKEGERRWTVYSLQS